MSAVLESIAEVLAFRVDLKRGLQQTHIGSVQVTGDSDAHEIRLEIAEGTQRADLGGCLAKVYFTRPDQVMVPLDGQVEGSTVKALLPEACFQVQGGYSVIIKLTKGKTRRAIFWGTGDIVRKGPDAAVDPEGIIPSLEALLAQIEACERAETGAVDAAKRANTAAGQANEAAAAANTAAKSAETKAAEANTAAKSAEMQAGAARSAAQEAGKQAGEAQTAANAANVAAGQADKAALAANEAAGKANKAVTDIAAAKTDAEQAVQDANAAVEIAGAWSGAKATAETIPHGQPPTVSVVDGPEGRVLHVQVPEGRQGPKGEPGKLNEQTLAEIYRKAMLDAHPVGSLYITLSDEFPGITFGGDWVREAEGRTILGAGTPKPNSDGYFGQMSGRQWARVAGETGGQDYHRLTVDEMPSHEHPFMFVSPAGDSSYTQRRINDINSIAAIGGEWYTSSGTTFAASKGGGQLHNNMPPYKVFNVWRRVA